MGGALLKIWLKHFPDIHFHVINPSPLSEEFQNHTQITHHKKITSQNIESELIILAVKPQILANICLSLKNTVPENTCILSIIAGRSLNWIANALDTPTQPILRVMPNMAVQTGKGTSIGIANAHASDSQKENINALFKPTGLFEWIDDESHMHAITALSGSGPAYFYYIIEALHKAASDNGLPHDLSANLIRQTLIGTASILENTQTSPGNPAHSSHLQRWNNSCGFRNSHGRRIE